MFRDDVDRLFAELFPGGRRGGAPDTRTPVDVYVADSTPPSLVVEVDVAGVDPDEVDVTLDDNVLVVRGVRRRGGEDARRSYQHAEIGWGPFERRLRLNVAVEPAQAAATCERGILRVRLPLAARPPARRVEIDVREDR